MHLFHSVPLRMLLETQLAQPDTAHETIGVVVETMLRAPRRGLFAFELLPVVIVVVVVVLVDGEREN